MSVTYDTQPASSNGTLVMRATIPNDGQDEQIARDFFAELEHRAKVDEAVADYDERVRENRPYEDVSSVEELARRLGR